MRVALAVLLGIVSWIVLTFTYIWLVAPPNTKAVGFTLLLTSPLYWLLLILMIGAEVWLWRQVRMR
jgi:hypothetical protein